MNDEIRKKVSNLPNKAGVYLMRDRLGRVIYVGKARSLRKRVAQYFHPSRRMTADLKTRALVESIRDFDVQVVKSDPEAILLEGKLIKEFRPKYNISFRDDKRFLLVKVNLNDPFPRFTLARFKKDDGARYFGPYAHAAAVRNTLNLLRKRFHLRLCNPTVPTERDYKHCLYHIIQHCSAPCIGAVTREEYRRTVEQACEFLDGKNEELLIELEEQMKLAAQKLDFERAAMVRNQINDLREMNRKTRKFERFRRERAPEEELAELQKALRLQFLPRHIEGFDISNISGTHCVASMVCFRNGRPDRGSYRRYRIKTVEGIDDFAMMREVVQRRYRRLVNEKKPLPELILIDGGKGQLSAALNAVAEVGTTNISVAALAKQQEEIYLPNKPNPIVLPRDSGALHLLQRIRDEAHRFANAYHLALRKRLIEESILDDFAGIGENRKRLLLKKFGSVRRLRTATVEQIGVVPGFGGKTAQELHEFLLRTHGGLEGKDEKETNENISGPSRGSEEADSGNLA